MNVKERTDKFAVTHMAKVRARTAKSNYATEVIAMERAIARRNGIELLAILHEEDEIEHGE